MRRKSSTRYPVSVCTTAGRRGLPAMTPASSESPDLPDRNSRLPAAATEPRFTNRSQRLPAMVTGHQDSLDLPSVAPSNSSESKQYLPTSSPAVPACLISPPLTETDNDKDSIPPLDLESQQISPISSPTAPACLASPPVIESDSDRDFVSPFGFDNPCQPPSSNEIKSIMKDLIINSGLLCQKGHEVSAILQTAEWITTNGDDFMKYKWRGETIEYFVRPCYKDIYTILDDIGGTKGSPYNRKTDSRCTFITGTPGIGKSIFSLILCHMLCDRQKQTLLFFEAPHMPKSVFWDGRGFLVNDETQALLLIEDIIDAGLCSVSSYDEDIIEIWSIADSALPIQDPFIRQICITSTADAYSGMFVGSVKHWIKDNLARTLAMPPCSWEEILKIRAAVFKNMKDQMCPLDKLTAQFSLWGGVPRTILGLSETSDLENFEDREFRQMRIKDVLKCLGAYNFDHQLDSGRIFHLYPGFPTTKEEYDKLNLTSRYTTARARYHWASEALERKAWAYFRRQQEAKVVEYILATWNDAGSRGKAFEEHIHQLIATTGLEGNLTNLETGEEIENFRLKPQKTMFFATFDEIDSSAEYWRPIAHNHASLDGYLPASGIMIQMMVGKTHAINAAGLEKTLKSGIFAEWENKNPTQKKKFIFMVHEESAEIRNKQSLTFGESEQKKTSRRRPRGQEAIEERIEQYVLKVDLEGRLKKLRSGQGYKRVRDKDEGPITRDKRLKLS